MSSSTNTSTSTYLSATFPNEFRTPPPARLQSLYSDIHRQKQSNPEGFRSSIGWWTRVLDGLVRNGKQPESDDALVLHVGESLGEALRWEKVGRPLGLGCVVEELANSRVLVPLQTFLKSPLPMNYQPGLAYRVAAFVVGKPF
ncbi:hypothetical protein FRB90_011525, partial [Tulasnella sp. 427]